MRVQPGLEPPAAFAINAVDRLLDFHPPPPKKSPAVRQGFVAR